MAIISKLVKALLLCCNISTFPHVILENNVIHESPMAKYKMTAQPRGNTLLAFTSTS